MKHGYVIKAGIMILLLSTVFASLFSLPNLSASSTDMQPADSSVPEETVDSNTDIDGGDTLPVEAAGILSVPDIQGYELIIESTELGLYAAQDNLSIAVIDKRTGHLWESSVDPDRLTRKANKLWGAYIKSMFIFQYAKVTDLKGDIQTGCAAEDVTSVKRTAVSGGFRLEFELAVLKISLAVEFTIEKDHFKATIPEASITDGEKNYLVSLDLLPFLGSATDTDDGYYFYPNGPGELYYFKDISLRQNSLKEYIIPYYSQQTVDIGGMQTEEVTHSQIKAMLPVYGVKIGNSGFVAITEDGDEYTSLHIAPGGVAVSINRIFNSFTYRKSYGVYGSSISIAGGTQVFPLAILLDADRYAGDRCVEYIFLADDAADYSGMANTVRDNFIENGVLPQEPIQGDEAPVMLDILGGIRQKKLFFSFYKKLTTFSQTREIVSDLTEAGVGSLMINLKGWNSKGLLSAPNNYPASWKLGGKSGLRALAKSCSGLNVKLFLNVNYLDIFEGNGGYSLASDAARDPNNYMYTNADKTRYLMSPASAAVKSAKLLKYLKNVGVYGILYEKFGGTVYSDHARRHTSLTGETIKTWEEILSETKTQVGAAATSGGNLYAAGSSEVLTDIPDRSVSVLFGDETVPFYQMVVHGSVYYTGTQINLFYDSVAQKLKMIEYGFIPYFELTYVSSKELSDTQYNVLFSSEYATWRQSIIDYSAELTGRLGSTYGAYMTDHKKLAENVYRVTYSDSTAVYINYGTSPWTGENTTVPAEDYLVRKGGIQS